MNTQTSDPRTTTITREMWEHFQRLSEEHHERQRAEIERLRELLRTTEERLAKALEALTERAFNRCLFPAEVREAFNALDAYRNEVRGPPAETPTQ